ncbi:MAG: hypothetical protein JXR37_32890, partial [Kiritimatiellae bacterium]|nr:hypothetical protein [Kiritimatiellia bacterium]
MMDTHRRQIHRIPESRGESSAAPDPRSSIRDLRFSILVTPAAFAFFAYFRGYSRRLCVLCVLSRLFPP